MNRTDRPIPQGVFAAFLPTRKAICPGNEVGVIIIKNVVGEAFGVIELAMRVRILNGWASFTADIILRLTTAVTVYFYFFYSGATAARGQRRRVDVFFFIFERFLVYINLYKFLVFQTYKTYK